jgi:hypothetical protein
VRCLIQAWDDDVFGVPYMRIGRDRFWGLDRVPDFLAVFQPEPREERDDAMTDTGIPSELHERIGAYDQDTAGGCG